MKLSYIGAASALLAFASAGPTPIPGIKKPLARGYSSENVGNCLFGPDEHDDPFGSNTDGDESPADNGCGSRNDPLTSNLDTEHGGSSAINSMPDPVEGDSLPDHPLQDGGAAIAATAAPTPKKPNTRSLAASGHKPRFGYLPNSPSTHDHSHPQHHHKGIPNETPKTSETQGIFKIPEFFNFFKPSETPKTPKTPEASEAPKTPETLGIFKIPEFFNFFKTSETSEAPKTYKIYKVLETGETPGAFEDSEDSENFGTLEIPKTPETDRVFETSEDSEAADAFEDPDTFENVPYPNIYSVDSADIKDIKNGEISKIGIESDNSVDKFRTQIMKAYADAEQLKGSGLSLENLAAELRFLQDKLDKDMAKYQNVQNARFFSLKAEYNKVRKPKKQESTNGETAVEQDSQDSSEIDSSSVQSHPVTDLEIE